MAENKMLEYKEKPLVRKGNEIYYGDMTDPFVVRFEILSKTKSAENENPSKIKIQLLKSDVSLPMSQRVEKESVQDSMFEALDFGFVWLERALKA